MFNTLLKPTSKSKLLKFWLLAAVFIFCRQAFAQFEPNHEAVIRQITDENKLLADSRSRDWYPGETLAVVSANPGLGVIGFVEVLEAIELFEGKFEGNFEVRLSLKRQNRKYFIRAGDTVKRLDLTSFNSEYFSSTELLLKDGIKNISSRYRPLVHQGIIIGDTAQTLFEKEFLFNYFGNIYYGFNDWLTVGTLVPT